jgi:hypothetical protein
VPHCSWPTAHGPAAHGARPTVHGPWALRGVRVGHLISKSSDDLENHERLRGMSGAIEGISTGPGYRPRIGAGIHGGKGRAHGCCFALCIFPGASCIVHPASHISATSILGPVPHMVLVGAWRGSGGVVRSSGSGSPCTSSRHSPLVSHQQSPNAHSGFRAREG